MTKLTPEQVQQYHEDGYIVLKAMLSPEQIGLLGRTAHEDRVLDQHSFGKADGEGGSPLATSRPTFSSPLCSPLPAPSPGCFLEVLIVEGLRLHVLEVLILEDLLSAMLILMDFKSFIISDLIKNEGFTEVLILGGLGRARCTDGWAVVG